MGISRLGSHVKIMYIDNLTLSHGEIVPNKHSLFLIFLSCGSDCLTSNCEIGNYNNADEVRKCRLSGLRDLAGGDEYVRV